MLCGCSGPRSVPRCLPFGPIADVEEFFVRWKRQPVWPGEIGADELGWAVLDGINPTVRLFTARIIGKLWQTKWRVGAGTAHDATSIASASLNRVGTPRCGAGPAQRGDPAPLVRLTRAFRASPESRRPNLARGGIRGE